MKLSYRLETIASFVRKGSIVADIGTDHGYIPIYLVNNEIIPSALAMDVRKGPLLRAEEHVWEYGLQDQIVLRLSDGLTKLLPGEADTVIIAGMGGGLLIHILSEGKHVWDSVAHFILSPQSDISDVRAFLAENGFSIERETMITEEGKFYTIMDVVRGTMTLEKKIYCRFGRHLIEESNTVLKEYLEKEKKTLSDIADSLEGQDSEGAKKRQSEIAKELALIEEADHEMQRNH